jgi:hypothetical protein
LLLFGSEVLELIVAVFETVVLSATPALTLTTSVTTGAEPTGKLGLVQLIGPVPPTAGVVPHVQPVPLMDLKVVLTGVVSDSVKLVAESGPKFDAVIE